jgi:acyl-coenzyme A thioesterase PaaI-like protein
VARAKDGKGNASPDRIGAAEKGLTTMAQNGALSLQETYFADGVCFGCGPKNPHGLRIRSFPEGDDGCIARFTPEPHHLAFPGVLNGGICGALIDCHSNWTAAFHLMRKAHPSAAASPPCTVTAEFAVQLKRPTPMDTELIVRSRVVAAEMDRATVEATIEANGRITATGRGIFVAVKEGHPAFHRW